MLSSKNETISDSKLAEKLPAIIFFASRGGAVEYVNQRWVDITGRSRAQASLAEQWLSAQHPEDRFRIDELWHRALRVGKAFTAELRLRVKGGSYRWHLLQADPFHDECDAIVRWYGILTDIHDYKRMEDTQRFLSDATKELTVSLNPERTLQTIAQLTIPQLADFCEISLISDGLLRSVTWTQQDIPAPLWLREFIAYHPSIVLERDFGPGHALYTGKPHIMNTIPPMMLQEFASEEEKSRLLHMAESQSVLLVPLISGGKALGIMTLAFMDASRRYTPEQIPLACELSSRATLALENAQAYTTQLELATNLQRVLLPTVLPIFEELVMSSYYQPAGSVSRIGGDWYDAFALDKNRVAFSIGDVAGHGTSAALLMGEVRQALRGGLLEGETLLASMRRANLSLLTHSKEFHVTALLAVLDHCANQMVYVNAGHPPPFLRDGNGSVKTLEEHGIPLGIAPDINLFATNVDVPPGAGIIFYTDGLIEARGNVAAGLGELISVVSALPRFTNQSAGEIAKKILPRRTRQDDVAVMTVFVKPRGTDF